MMKKNTDPLLIIGDANSKRTLYFQKAAQKQNINIRLIPYNFTNNRFTNNYFNENNFADASPIICKIDPPSYDCLNEEKYRIDSMHNMAKNYVTWLSSLPLPSDRLRYLNDPSGIALLLNKYECKQALMRADIPVTPILGVNISCYEEIRQVMKDAHCYFVFVKPNFSSGASGILAYRYHPVTGQEQLFTSACMNGDCIVNTKKMFCYRDSHVIQELFRNILPLGTITERLLPKTEYAGLKYDLRVLYQFGTIAFITVRQSKGPITNLHLNNMALPTTDGTLPSCLSLTRSQIDEMEDLCHRAVSCLHGIRVAGIDILFEKATGKPKIIEINGQGDLLYQDIYHENKIYSQQAAYMKNNQIKKGELF